jgi:hypothetical protein
MLVLISSSPLLMERKMPVGVTKDSQSGYPKPMHTFCIISSTRFVAPPLSRIILPVSSASLLH